MPGFLYYLPKHSRRITLAEISALGLGYAFDRQITPAEVLAHGPDGGAGVIVADPQRVEPGRIGMHADQQIWRKMAGRGDAAWVGMYADQRPTPADLARPSPLAGHAVTLGDGHEWLAPIARFLDGEPAVPRWSDLDAHGEWRPGVVIDRYAELWRVAEAWWDTLARAEVVDETAASAPRLRFDFSGLHAGAVACLAANYALGATEAAMLRLLSDQVAREILNAAVDWPTFVAWVQKKTKAAIPEPAAT
jgi:hypothetical protein